MGFFDNLVRNEEEPQSSPTPGSFTTEQWAELTGLLKLEPETATADDVLDTIKEIIDEAKQLSESNQKEATMNFLNNAVDAPITIDRRVWNEMQDAIHRGVTARDQDNRLAAEQVVNQAVRIGKVSATQREDWIKSYLNDPESTVRAMNRRQEIPRVEVGHGRAPNWDKEETPQGWVR